MAVDLKPPPGLRVGGICESGGHSIVLIAPDEPAFWPIFIAAPEYADGTADPMDRWSRRVIGASANAIGVEALFPSDPPYPPFVAWALLSGRFWSSPTGMLVDRRMGLFVSFRGALRVPGPPAKLNAHTSPCTDCDAPCLSACPVDAFTDGRYDTDACHRWLDTPAGGNCLAAGCLARRACPISKGCGRLPEQSAWHMRQFHP
ncbi:ferredoxin [Paracoccus sp. TK19116]|uniref:Ferredoxin n=1 Tax=Paracoccus albicereus TaxID=2922394 RepID=A0ABT1MT72_9RHOB|nr:ferredoxin [Paracoccus albicereus]MCQ0970716.1 ferredoxin [Paracoccus albicereus]